MSANQAQNSAASAAVFPGITVADIQAAIAEGTERALRGAICSEVRAFLEEYFGCLNKQEVAAFLGVSDRTVELLWEEGKLTKDTALGDRMPRVWLPAVKEMLAKSRIKAREVGSARLRVVRSKTETSTSAAA